MAHEVESMFSVGETPWHGLGVVVKNAPNTREAIDMAGANWLNLSCPIFTEIPVTVIDEMSGKEVQTVKRINLSELGQAFIRSDNHYPLGVVGPKTHILQNVEAFDFFDDYVTTGQASLETAGVLRNGQKVWVMARINKANSEIVRGDDVAKFVLLSNSHDGSTAVRVGFTPIRVVCANTLSLAHGDKASKLIRVRHSKDVKKNVDNIKEIMNLADAEFEATAEQFRFLASKQINLSDLRKYVKLVFDMEMDDAKMAKKTVNIMQELLDLHEKRTGMLADAVQRAFLEDAIRSGKVQAVQAICDKVEENMEAGRGTDNPASRGTFWTAYNAVTEYLNHQRGNGSRDVRLESVWFGESLKVNQKALTVATDLANGK